MELRGSGFGPCCHVNPAGAADRGTCGERAHKLMPCGHRRAFSLPSHQWPPVCDPAPGVTPKGPAAKAQGFAGHGPARPGGYDETLGEAHGHRCAANRGPCVLLHPMGIPRLARNPTGAPLLCRCHHRPWPWQPKLDMHCCRMPESLPETTAGPGFRKGHQMSDVEGLVVVVQALLHRPPTCHGINVLPLLNCQARAAEPALGFGSGLVGARL